MALSDLVLFPNDWVVCWSGRAIHRSPLKGPGCRENRDYYNISKYVENNGADELGVRNDLHFHLEQSTRVEYFVHSVDLGEDCPDEEGKSNDGNEEARGARS